MITKTTTYGGAFLVLAGLFGFIAPEFLGLHLGSAHNLLFVLSGAASLYFGLMTPQSSGRTFCIVLGAFYDLLGLVGFVAGGLSGTFTLVAGSLVLGTMDHLMHIVIGAWFVTTGLLCDSSRSLFLDAANKY